MTEPSDTEHLRSIVSLQISLLDLYESLLESSTWDEAQANATLKVFMSSVLALMRVQRSLGAKVVTVQRDLIREHRERLEQWLANHGEPPTNPDDHVAGGRSA
jgi:hypothetical protein